ncbi:MAG: hypothetical protein JM58_07500 [Peptococcaceae bacterium BICA1-8]|nr:MAG: hypothetical protein JM58_07500 [Peptococcaceae bacterium BICA1-8]
MLNKLLEQDLFNELSKDNQKLIEEVIELDQQIKKVLEYNNELMKQVEMQESKSITAYLCL